MFLALRLPTAASFAHAAPNHRPGSLSADARGRPRVETRIGIPDVLDWLTPRDKRPVPCASPLGVGVITNQTVALPLNLFVRSSPHCASMANSNKVDARL